LPPANLKYFLSQMSKTMKICLLIIAPTLCVGADLDRSSGLQDAERLEKFPRRAWEL
jgi:hypothetical protein